MKKSIQDLRHIILAAYEAADQFATQTRRIEGPSGVNTNLATGRAQAYLAVLDLLGGHTAMIKQHGGGEISPHNRVEVRHIPGS